MKKLRLDQLKRLDVEGYKSSEKIPLVVVCDNIRSALNVGSIFRTADGFRCKAIYLCGITATPPSREVHKTAIGAEEAVDWKYFDHTQDALTELQEEGFQIVAIEQTDRSISLQDYTPAGGVAIVLGNEVHGVSEDALRHTDLGVEIPQYGTKHSFNVSVCAGIVMWHVSQCLRHN